MSQSLTKGQVLFNGTIVATNASSYVSNTTIYTNIIDLGDYNASSDKVVVTIHILSSSVPYSPFGNAFLRLWVFVYDLFGSVMGFDSYGPFPYAESPLINVGHSDSIVMDIDLYNARRLRFQLAMVSLVQNASANVQVSIQE